MQRQLRRPLVIHTHRAMPFNGTRKRPGPAMSSDPGHCRHPPRKVPTSLLMDKILSIKQMIRMEVRTIEVLRGRRQRWTRRAASHCRSRKKPRPGGWLPGRGLADAGHCWGDSTPTPSVQGDRGSGRPGNAGVPPICRHKKCRPCWRHRLFNFAHTDQNCTLREPFRRWPRRMAPRPRSNSGSLSRSVFSKFFVVNGAGRRTRHGGSAL
jgi:hypothetical protein